MNWAFLSPPCKRPAPIGHEAVIADFPLFMVEMYTPGHVLIFRKSIELLIFCNCSKLTNRTRLKVPF